MITIDENMSNSNQFTNSSLVDHNQFQQNLDSQQQQQQHLDPNNIASNNSNNSVNQFQQQQQYHQQYQQPSLAQYQQQQFQQYQQYQQQYQPQPPQQVFYPSTSGNNPGSSQGADFNYMQANQIRNSNGSISNTTSPILNNPSTGNSASLSNTNNSIHGPNPTSSSTATTTNNITSSSTVATNGINALSTSTANDKSIINNATTNATSGITPTVGAGPGNTQNDLVNKLKTNSNSNSNNNNNTTGTNPNGNNFSQQQFSELMYNSFLNHIQQKSNNNDLTNVNSSNNSVNSNNNTQFMNAAMQRYYQNNNSSHSANPNANTVPNESTNTNNSNNNYLNMLDPTNPMFQAQQQYQQQVQAQFQVQQQYQQYQKQYQPQPPQPLHQSIQQHGIANDNSNNSVNGSNSNVDPMIDENNVSYQQQLQQQQQQQYQLQQQQLQQQQQLLQRQDPKHPLQEQQKGKRGPKVHGNTKKLPKRLSTTQSRIEQRKRLKKQGPKRPSSAYFLFSMSIRSTLLKEYPEAKVPELSKLASARWKQLSDEEKKPFYDEFRTNWDKYRILRDEYEKTLPPKRPSGPFIHFTQEVRPIILKENPDCNLIEITKIIGERWRNLDPVEKSKYTDTYKRKLKEWEKCYPPEGISFENDVNNKDMNKHMIRNIQVDMNDDGTHLVDPSQEASEQHGLHDDVSIENHSDLGIDLVDNDTDNNDNNLKHELEENNDHGKIHLSENSSGKTTAINHHQIDPLAYDQTNLSDNSANNNNTNVSSDINSKNNENSLSRNDTSNDNNGIKGGDINQKEHSFTNDANLQQYSTHTAVDTNSTENGIASDNKHIESSNTIKASSS